jgi:hypothetical protein
VRFTSYAPTKTAAEFPAAVMRLEFMPYPPRQIAPALVTEARRLYEDTNVPVRDIAALVGLSERTFYTRVHKWKWRMRCDRIPNAALDRAAAVDSAKPELPPERSETAETLRYEQGADTASLAERLQRAVERELAAVEALIARLGNAADHDADAERSARTLGTLSRVLRELAKLQRDEKPESESSDSEDEFRDLEEFRAELAERLDRLRRSRDAS